MIKQVTLDNIELTPENGYYLSAVSGLGYNTKYPVTRIAQQHGVGIGQGFYDNRVLSFEIKVIGTSPADYAQKRRTLFEAFSLDQFEADIKTVEITTIDDLTITAHGIVKGLSDDVNTDSTISGDVAFTFEMQEPFFKSEQIYQQDIFITGGGGCAVPMAIPLDMSAGGIAPSEITQGGNVMCFPELYFYGDLTNPVLTHVASDKEIALAATITGTDYYYIDTYNRIVQDNTTANKRDLMSGDFLVLRPGLNQFTLSTDNPTESGYVRVIYKYYFISI